MAEPIRVYFDFLSPFACIGWYSVRPLAARHGRPIEPVPTLLAALLDAHGQKGPAEVPAKRAYVFKDAYRKAHRAGLGPLTPPPAHPFNPLLALRACSLPLEPGARERLVDGLFRRAWLEGAAIDTDEAVARVADAAGLPGVEIVARAKEPPAKEALRSQTERAIAAGVFGVPSFVVGGELFFGVDGLESLDAFLDGRDPLPPGLLERWASLGASAWRRNAGPRP
ncbi:MAG TPA: 2-hydroxychromene-2-carboxylate isomerase [Polyangiaceae bacterium]|nr:2-hydroxychromene-2-carboxylate isomerase [Polyangiaceae bacterium]